MLAQQIIRRAVARFNSDLADKKTRVEFLEQDLASAKAEMKEAAAQVAELEAWMASQSENVE